MEGTGNANANVQASLPPIRYAAGIKDGILWLVDAGVCVSTFPVHKVVVIEPVPTFSAVSRERANTTKVTYVDDLQAEETAESNVPWKLVVAAVADLCPFVIREK